MPNKIPRSPFSTRLSGSAKETELRLRNIFQWEKKRPPVVLFVLTAAAVLLCCSLVSCESKEEEPPADDPAAEDSVQVVDPVEVQLQLIAGCTEIWAVAAEYANEYYSYAVADLDGNGRLELIAANQGGTGHYTYARFFEVNEACTDLVPCSYTTQFAHDGESQADIIVDTVDAYYSSDTGVTCYIFDDYGKLGVAEYPEVKLALHLEDGQVRAEALAKKRSVFKDDSTLDYTSITDWTGAKIFEVEYDAIADRYFAGCQKLSVTFGWLGVTPEEAQSTDTETLALLLAESYRGFTAAEQAAPEATDALPVYNVVEGNGILENAQESLTASQRTLLANLPVEELPKEAVELGRPFRSDFWRDLLIPLAYDQEYDVTLYGVVGNVPNVADGIAILNQTLVTDGIVLRIGNRASYFPVDWDCNNWSGQNPWMVVDDFTGDGQPEAAVCLHWERGTGVHLESLSFIDLETLSSMAAVDCTSLEVTARYDDAAHTVVLSSGDLNTTVRLSWDVDPPEKLSFGRDYITYFYEDGHLFCTLPLSVSTISYIAEVTVPVVWTESDFQLGEAVSLTAY